MTSRKKDDLADARTPLIFNAWYVAATSAEVQGDLMDRWLLGRNILLYRTGENQIAALDNRCPHRSFPLSHGRRVGDNVACGYHGMTFGPDGRCLRVPAMARGPTNLYTRAYPIVERDPLIWIWLGDPAAADEALIPAHFPLWEEGWATASGYYRVEANYVGLQENLQDLSHFEHLHRSTIGAPDESAAEIKIEDRLEGLFSTRVYSNVLAAPMWKSVLKLAGDRMTRTIVEAVRSPAHCEALTTITDEARDPSEKRDHHMKIVHFITPEFQHSTHYFWFFMRDFGVEELAVGENVRAGIAAAFLEDKEALESISKLTQMDGRADFRELSFASDRSGMLLRRRLAEFAKLEQIPEHEGAQT